MRIIYRILIILVVVILLYFGLLERDRRFSETPWSYYDYYIENAPMTLGTGILNNVYRSVSKPYSNWSLDYFPEHKILEENYPIIRDEYDAAIKFLKKNNVRVKRMNELSESFNRIGDNKWNVIVLKWYNKPNKNALLFPKTIKIIESIPNLHIAMFSTMEPGKHVLPHRGPFTGCLRYHLGIDVPSGDLFIKVDGKKYKWENGKSLLFDDTFTHEVQNNTDKSRTILFCDIERPMPYLFKELNKNLIKVLPISKELQKLNKDSELDFNLK